MAFLENIQHLAAGGRKVYWAAAIACAFSLWSDHAGNFPIPTQFKWLVLLVLAASAGLILVDVCELLKKGGCKLLNVLRHFARVRAAKNLSDTERTILEIMGRDPYQSYTVEHLCTLLGINNEIEIDHVTTRLERDKGLLYGLSSYLLSGSGSPLFRLTEQGKDKARELINEIDRQHKT